MADTLREALKIAWSGTDVRQETAVDDLRGVVVRDLGAGANPRFVYTAMAYAGVAKLFRMVDCGGMERGKELCEMAMAAECWRRAA